jgi:hypothetical protein
MSELQKRRTSNFKKIHSIFHPQKRHLTTKETEKTKTILTVIGIFLCVVFPHLREFVYAWTVIRLMVVL